MELEGQDPGASAACAKPSSELYLSFLSLNTAPLHAATSVHLPVTERPHLSRQQHRALQKWANAVQTATLPNSLLDISAASPAALPLDGGIGVLGVRAQKLVESAISDLQRKMEEKNVHWLQSGHCVRQAHRIVLSLSIFSLDVAEESAVAQLGVHLDGLCRAVAEHDVILGSGGWRLLQVARRALREWFKARDIDWSSIDFGEAYEHVRESLSEGIPESVRVRASLMAVASYEAVRMDMAHDTSGLRGERTLKSRLSDSGILRDSYICEEQLREAQTKIFGKVVYSTPDVLFRTGILVNGSSVVHWIDSKSSCLLPGFCFGSQLQKLRNQLTNFVELFGPGMVVWQGGFATVATDNLPGVRSAAWMTESDEAGPHGDGDDTEVWMRWQ